MNNKLFVGNVPFAMTEADLAKVFSDAGRVVSIRMPLERESGRKRGFAFVEMEDEISAYVAIYRFDGEGLNGRTLAVQLAKPRDQKNNSGFSGYTKAS